MSEPVLNQLLDHLLQQDIINQEEMETIRTKTRSDGARDVIDTVRKKGAEASSSFINVICKVDPHLSRTLQLNWTRAETG